MNRIEVLPKEIADVSAGKNMKRESVENIMRQTLNATIEVDMDGSGGKLSDCAKILLVFCQILWNDREEIGEKFIELYETSKKMSEALHKAHDVVTDKDVLAAIEEALYGKTSEHASN